MGYLRAIARKPEWVIQIGNTAAFIGGRSVIAACIQLHLYS
ncbi:MAG: hypothetical protein VKL39_10900 [Leptolyngbyaceae bacterium]|nr:hypothetical protein [Leptolyngbyaceae bacterium]